MTQALFGAGEHRLVIARLYVDDAISGETNLGDRRREQVRTRQAPKDVAGRARSDTGNEKRRGGAVDGAVAAAGDFMQRAELQALPW